jgi:adenylate kinase family enzyme
MPAENIVPLLDLRIAEISLNGTSKILLDGFPRNREGAELFAREVGTPNLVIYFETPKRRATEQYLSVVRKRFDSVSDEDEKKLVQQRFGEHEKEMSGLVEYLDSQGNFVKVWPDLSFDISVSSL